MIGSTMTRRSRVVAVGGLVALATSLLAVTPAAAAPPGCDNRTNNSAAKLMECVTVEGVREHQEALQGIADANGGNRASGLPGYDASVDYVVAQAEAAGLTVTTQDFEFPFFRILSQSLEQTAPTPTTYEAGADFTTMTFSGSGTAAGTAVPVDLGTTSGCEAADFGPEVTGQIALMQRGACAFGVKAQNALAAGAVGAIIFNSGVDEGSTGLLNGTLGAPVALPVVGTTFALGAELAGTEVALETTSEAGPRITTNVFAEVPGRTDSVLMVGAHLDSVPAGPGINDNGSGSAAILEVAQNVAKTKPEQTIRFAWWGAEELGLLGAEYYVDTLPQPERDRISAYLNFDMVGSPNFARFVYDGDDSDAQGAPAGPLGSEAIEDVFETFYTERGLTYEGTDFSGRSDYGPFIAPGVDIPSGGLFTGAEGIKTEAQAARYGGEAGVAFDPCYHQACDTFDNNSNEVLDQNSDAIAYAVATLSATLELVPTGAPAGTPGDTGSGGGLHDHDHEVLSS
jgi:Zn-dependent M28 family amino/carboxypeptidase